MFSGWMCINWNCCILQVWNHPWVLKLDEIRKAERALDYEDSEEGNDSLGGFIVSEGSDVERLEKARRKKKKKKKVHVLHLGYQDFL